MEFKQLVSYCKPMRQLKTDLIIVITSFDSYGLVVSHLKLLSKQTYQRFNVLLVLGVAFDDKKLGAYLEENQFAFGIILAKENDRRGCSGGFFTGQKYALENGYEYIIMADDDCMPVDKGLVEALYSKRAAKYVRPTTVFVAGSYRKKGFAAGPSQYSLYSAEVFREYGLYYLPLYHGADDGEYMERVKQPYIHIPNNTEHPYISGMRLFGVFDRQWLFMLQSLIIMRSIRTTLYNLTQYAFMAAVSLCFLPPYGRRLFVLMNGLLLTYTYGKEANRRVRSGYEKSILPSLPNSPFVQIDEQNAQYIDEGGKKKITGLAMESLRHFRKDVVIENTYSFLKAFFLSISARRLYVKISDGQYLLFADNSLLPLHLLKLIAFPFALALQAMMCVLFLIVKAIRQPNTMRYGLN